MKKLYLLSIFWLIATVLTAAPVDLTSAKNIAHQFMCQKGMKSNVTFVDVTPAQYSGFYILNCENADGFVIVAADDRTYDVLGYSLESKFQSENIPDVVSYWLNGYEEQMKGLMASNADIVKPTKSTVQTDEEVESLVTAKWGQGYPYNMFCPMESSLDGDEYYNGHVTTGCTNNAMAMVMHYWQWPERGTGSFSYNFDSETEWHYGTLSANFEEDEYDWSIMPDQLTSNSPAYQIEAVAKLMYHCGIASNTFYNVDGLGSSGAYISIADMTETEGLYTSCAELAMKTNFGYKSTVQGLIRANYSDAVWIGMLKEELRASRPIIYQGVMSNGAGHSFILDGFSGDYFHMNFGWGGIYNANYLINSIGPEQSDYQFNYYQEGLFYLEPDRPIVGIDNQTSRSAVRIWGGENQIHIENAENQMATVYDLLGRNRVTTNITSQHQSLNVPSHGLYIVKVGQEAFKVLVR